MRFLCPQTYEDMGLTEVELIGPLNQPTEVGTDFFSVPEFGWNRCRGFAYFRLVHSPVADSLLSLRRYVERLDRPLVVRWRCLKALCSLI